MTKNEWRLFWALNDKLIALLDRHVDLYFEERPFLEKPTEMVKEVTKMGTARMVPQMTSREILYKEKETKQVELEINVLCAKINELLNPKEPVSDAVTQSIFGS